MLEGVETVGSGRSRELRRQCLQLHHQAGVQGLQQGRLELLLLLLHLHTLDQLLQLQQAVSDHIRQSINQSNSADLLFSIAICLSHLSLSLPKRPEKCFSSVP